MKSAQGVIKRVASMLGAIAFAALFTLTASTSSFASAAPSGAAPSVQGLQGTGIRVMYQGHSVTYSNLNRTLGATYCDDHLGYGRLTCYSSQRQMQTAILGEGGYNPIEAAQISRRLNIKITSHIRNTAATSGTCHPYVVGELYSLSGGAGSEVSVWCDYPNLGTIGWANKTHSGKSPSCQAILGNNDYCESIFAQQNYVHFITQFTSILSNLSAMQAANSYSVIANLR